MSRPGWRSRAHRAMWRRASARPGTAASGLRDFRLAPPTWPESFLGRLVHFVKRDAVLLPDAACITARREAENLRCSRADEADAFAGELLELVDVDAFAAQQIAFH